MEIRRQDVAAVTIIKKRKSYKKKKNVTKSRYAGRTFFGLKNVLRSFGGKRT